MINYTHDAKWTLGKQVRECASHELVSVSDRSTSIVKGYSWPSGAQNEHTFTSGVTSNQYEAQKHIYTVGYIGLANI